MKSSTLGRKRNALERLEKQFEIFKKGNQDKIKNGKTIRSYDAECKRFEYEISVLKERLHM